MLSLIKQQLRLQGNEISETLQFAELKKCDIVLEKEHSERLGIIC